MASCSEAYGLSSVVVRSVAVRQTDAVRDQAGERDCVPTMNRRKKNYAGRQRLCRVVPDPSQVVLEVVAGRCIAKRAGRARGRARSREGKQINLVEQGDTTAGSPSNQAKCERTASAGGRVVANGRASASGSWFAT